MDVTTVCKETPTSDAYGGQPELLCETVTTGLPVTGLDLLLLVALALLLLVLGLMLSHARGRRLPR